MNNLKIKIIAYSDDSQPGWVKCCFADIAGEIHYFEEKVPVVTDKYLDEKSLYPQEGCLRCEILDMNNSVVRIDISKPLGKEDENGETIFEVLPDQLK